MMNMMMMSNAVASKAYFKRAECPVCYDELAAKPVAQLCKATGGASCSHQLHLDCARGLKNPKRCPVCSAAFSQANPVPSMAADLKAWFDFMDKDHNGTLHYDEIIDGLKSQMTLDWQRIEADVDSFWRSWDKDGSNSISFAEFSDPITGLAAYLSQHYPPKPKASPPDIRKGKEAWFEYWDEDGSGSLDKEEITRALIKTFRIVHVEHTVIREMIDAIWSLFDLDNSGKVDKREFAGRDNLGDTIIAQLSF